ncbi:MAG: hypothetical protein AABX13_05560 [Nanoarchaeota archaeon]
MVNVSIKQPTVSPTVSDAPPYIPYTKDVILEEVTRSEFERMEQFWGKHIRKSGRERYARVSNPVEDTEYESLLQRMLIHPLDVEICVNDQGKWRKVYKRKCTEEALQKFAGIAAADQYHRNYLEVKILAEGVENLWWNKAVIDFVEYRGRIIGYDVVIPPAVQSQFTWHYQLSAGLPVKVCGLWVPG